MADTTFTDQTTIIEATWLNEVNNLVHKIFGNPTYASQAITIDGSGNIQFANNLTIAGTLDVSGAFTSLGIDDNASATAITIDGSGNVGIGISSPASELHVHESSASAAGINITNGNTGTTALDGFRVGIAGGAGNALLWNYENTSMRFATNGTERMRINANGKVSIGTTSNTYPLDVTAPNDNLWVCYMNNTSVTNPHGILIDFTSASDDNNTTRFLECSDSVTTRFRVYSDGDVVNHDNSYGAISDIKFKQDISLAGSQWDDVKAIGNIVSKFRMKTDVEADENAPYKLGVIAQDLEQISPGLVTTHPATDEEEEHKSVKYSILYMKAVKALGEALEEIEQLKSRVSALEHGLLKGR